MFITVYIVCIDQFNTSKAPDTQPKNIQIAVNNTEFNQEQPTSLLDIDTKQNQIMTAVYS